MRIRYIGAAASTDAFGTTFPAHEWIPADDLTDHARETLMGNPHFETAEDGVLEAEAEADSAAANAEFDEAVNRKVHEVTASWRAEFDTQLAEAKASAAAEVHASFEARVADGVAAAIAAAKPAKKAAETPVV